MKKLLWLSLSLLLAAYGVLGYCLSRWAAPWLVWLVVLLFALGQAILLTSFSDDFKTSIRSWINSDVGHFTTIATAAFGIAAALVWFHLFQYLLMIGAAEILARVELQHSGFNRPKSLGVLTLLSLMGLGVGWMVSKSLVSVL